MKFVTLALALLLAVGSHAASIQADAPTQLQHWSSMFDMFLTQAKESIKRAMDRLDDEHVEWKEKTIAHLDEMHNYYKALLENTVTESIVTTISDTTAELRASVVQDITSLYQDTEDNRGKIKDTLERHITQYKEKMGVIRDLYATHKAEMENILDELKPLMEDMKTLVAVNVEETKAELMPIIEAMRTKFSERLENLKQMVSPFVEEYKDQFNQARNIDPSEITALKTKIEPMAEDVKTKLYEIFEAISATFNKS